jgi:hypothetical protein
MEGLSIFSAKFKQSAVDALGVGDNDDQAEAAVRDEVSHLKEAAMIGDIFKARIEQGIAGFSFKGGNAVIGLNQDEEAVFVAVIEVMEALPEKSLYVRLGNLAKLPGITKYNHIGTPVLMGKKKPGSMATFRLIGDAAFSYL